MSALSFSSFDIKFMNTNFLFPILTIESILECVPETESFFSFDIKFMNTNFHIPILKIE